MSKPTYKPLTRAALPDVIRLLGEGDPLLRDLALEFGTPPLWQRPQNFETLVHIVLEQKVSLASAHAVMQRVRQLCPKMSAEQFLDVPDTALRLAGISGRKITYCNSMAESLLLGYLDLGKLRSLPDELVLETLMRVKGIGPWTAGVYLLMAMRRPDAWASGDRALVISMAESAHWDSIPEYAWFDEYAKRWQPHRGTAARLLWHSYLQRRKRKHNS